MTDPKTLTEVLKSAVVFASVDPKNWNVGLQAEASIRAVLAELDRNGWQCFPREPTPEMYGAFLGYAVRYGGVKVDTILWKMMVDAAPKLGGE